MRTKGAKDKQPRKRAGMARGITKDPTENLPPGYNTELIDFILDIVHDEPTDIHDVEEMERRFYNYLHQCAKYDKKIGNLAAYAAIGITKEQARDWVIHPKLNPERASFIKKVQRICSLSRENLMADGKVNPVTGIFWQKNYDGMRDQQEVVVTPNNPLGDGQSAESLRQKYLENAYGKPAELPMQEDPVSIQ